MNIVFKKILGDPQAKTVKRIRKRVVSVNAQADKYKKMSDKELKEQTTVLKKRLKKEVDSRSASAKMAAYKQST